MEFSRTDPYEAKNRNGQGQDQGHNFASGPVKKVHRARTAHFAKFQDFRKKRYSSWKPKLRFRFLRLFSFLTNQKTALSSGRGQGIFEDCSLRGQGRGLELRGQILQNLCSGTPPLVS